MRVDELSVQILRESHDTIQELTSQVRELQERMNFLNGEFHDVLCSLHHRHLVKKFFTLRIKLPQVESQRREVQGDLSREVKNTNADVCSKAVNHEFFPISGSTEFYCSEAKTADIGASVG